jgi:hypothetical protein
MKLKSFGCSFVYGSDLSDCPHGINDDNPPPSRLTWPALLAQRYQLDYECYARPAAGNLQILETLLSQIDCTEDSIYVINWTWIERFSYVSSAKKTGRHPWNPLGWTSVMPSDRDEVAKIYYKYLHSEFRDKLESLVCINTAIDLLRDRNRRFIVTYTDDLVFQDQWHVSPATALLQEKIRPYVLSFENRSFFEWAKTSKFDMSTAGHPLEQAHAAAADKMSPVIDTILHKV